jgi:hypothetical protein
MVIGGSSLEIAVKTAPTDRVRCDRDVEAGVLFLPPVRRALRARGPIVGSVRPHLDTGVPRLLEHGRHQTNPCLTDCWLSALRLATPAAARVR